MDTEKKGITIVWMFESIKDLMKKIRSQELVQTELTERVEDKINRLSIEEKQTLIETIMSGIPLPEVYINISSRGYWRLIKGDYLFLLNDFILAENFPINGKHFSEMPQKIKTQLEEIKIMVIGVDIADPSNTEIIENRIQGLYL